LKGISRELTAGNEFSPGRDDISQYNKSPFLKRRSSLKSGMARPANVPRRRAFSKWLARHSIRQLFRSPA